MPQPVIRTLPALDEDNQFFWTSGADGRLRFRRCNTCGRLQHPPTGACLECRGFEFDVVPVSGRAEVAGVTVNEHQWFPGFPTPYAVAVVAIEEDPRIRLTTNIVECAPYDVVVGMKVEVVFEANDDVWIPLFRPSGGASAAGGTSWIPPDEDSIAPVRPMPTTRKFEHDVAITGAGRSQVGRRLMRHPVALAVEACTRAVEDAGLEFADIDGISTYPGLNYTAHYGSGHSEGGALALEEVLGLHPTWINGVPEGPGQFSAIVAAMLAVSSGLCRHVLCVRTMWEATQLAMLKARGNAVGGLVGADASARAGEDMQWRFPFGAASAANWIAVQASRHFHHYGTTRETLGWIALNNRANAGRNPEAIYREPLTMDDYLGARMITTPFGLYDCDVPCDGSTAFVISAVDTAGDGRGDAVFVDAVGTQITERASWDQGTLEHEPLVDGPARHLWTRSELTPADVDVAEIYDGFSFNCLSWIESLGFCAKGEAKDFLAGGTRIALDGDLPLNTDGGQLSMGRLHGFGLLYEAMQQLRGTADGRQVTDAEVAVVTAGGGEPGCAMLLTKTR